MDNAAVTQAAEIVGRGPSSRDVLPRLSLREHQVMWGIARGDGLNEIARALGKSPSTISTYRRRCRKKLGLKNNADIVRFVVKLEGK